MNCVSTKPFSHHPRPGSSGFTLLEILLAVAISSAFLAGAYTAYIQISKAHDASEARMDALRNARAALVTMSRELKSDIMADSQVGLTSVNKVLAFGDGIDNDGDGKIDEEIVDGKLDEAGGETGVSETSYHAKLGNLYERPLFTSQPDLGDAQVDVDAKFGHDEITFRTAPPPGMISKTISYYINETTFDGHPNVLMRHTEIESPDGGTPLTTDAPLAFGVLGLDLLYWNPNAQPQDQGWVVAWDSRLSDNFASPKLPLPASIYLRLTMYADPRPQAAVAIDGQPVQTVTLETVVDFEQTIGSKKYPRPNL
jgi:prepilin-type N-terminal cleavage/methylation domain-containing protein